MKDEPRKASGTETRQRDETVSFRASKSEKDKFNAIAKSHRQSIGDLMRSTLLGLPKAPARREPHPDREALARLLAELGKIGSNVNQLAKRANEGRFNEDYINDAMRELMEWRTLLMQALGYERRRSHSPDDELE